MKLSSSAFEGGVRLDAVYTVAGNDLSPPLTWSAPPAGTKSFAILCDDPDAPSARRPGPGSRTVGALGHFQYSARNKSTAVQRLSGPGTW